MSQQPYYGQSAYPGPPHASGPTMDPGLAKPWYGIGFWPAVKRVFAKYATFSGRASRGEYWWFALFNGIIGFGVSVLLLVGGINWAYFKYAYYRYGYAPMFNGFGSFLYGIDVLYGLAVLVPSLAVAVRRLHDINKSGAWWCVCFIPIAGPIWLLVMLATRTYPGATQWDAPSATVPPPGFPPQAYPPQGYPQQGFTPQGYPPQAPPPGYPPQGSGYPPQNYPPQGYPPQEGWR